MIVFLKEYFTFNKQHQKGFLVLWSIVLILLLAPFAFRYLYTPPPLDCSEFDREISEFEKGLTVKERSGVFRLVHFNPNSLTGEEWEGLGVSPKLARTLANYVRKGGRFYKKEDLRKIYGMDEKTYRSLAPYVKLPETKAESFVQQPVKEKSPVVEINTADSASLVKLKGIGPVLASRIIKFRNRLGGFSETRQLTEVYGLDSSVFRAMEKSLRVNKDLIRKININTATVEDLKVHPYISTWTLAKSIVNYREQHGKFKEIAELKKCVLVNEEIYRKIVYYLVAE
jgi:competence protein ComEA